MVASFSVAFGMADLHPWTTSSRAQYFYGSMVLFVTLCILIYVEIMHHPFFAVSFIVTSLIPLGLMITLPVFVQKSYQFYQEVNQTKRARIEKKEQIVSLFRQLPLSQCVTIGTISALTGYAIWHIDQKCVRDGWEAPTEYAYEYDWWYWAHPAWHVLTALSTVFFNDALIKVRMETYRSSLARREKTGSFITIVGLRESVNIIIGLRPLGKAQSS